MTNEALRASVQALLREHVTTFEQLEILLLLQAHPQTDWSAAAIGERTRIPHDLVVRALTDLTGSGSLAYSPRSC